MSGGGVLPPHNVLHLNTFKAQAFRNVIHFTIWVILYIFDVKVINRVRTYNNTTYFYFEECWIINSYNSFYLGTLVGTY